MNEMESVLISVIIPVYNVENYLDECLESVTRQTYKNLEIILIDDGSTDRSARICNAWRNKDKRIKVIHKENEGLGIARNVGLEHATGKYIMFLDSDDFWELNTVEILYNSIKDDGDVVYCGYKVFYDQDKVTLKPVTQKKEKIKKENVNSIILNIVGALPSWKDDIVIPMSVCFAMYSLEIIQTNRLKFFSERELISEDIFFNIDFLEKSSRVILISDCLYNYRKNVMTSLTTKYNPERFSKDIILYHALEDRLLKIFDRDEFIVRLQRTFLGRVRSNIIRAEKEAMNTHDEILRICCDMDVQEVLKEYPYHKNKFKLVLFNTCIRYKFIYILIFLVRLNA